MDIIAEYMFEAQGRFFFYFNKGLQELAEWLKKQ